MCTPRWPSSSGALSSIFAAARRRTLKLPIKLIAITRSNSARSWGPLRPAVFSPAPMPAQLTLTRSPSWPAAASTAAWTCLSSVTSVAMNRAPSSSANASPRSASMSATVTFAPASRSARAVAAPRPDAPPATSAFLPSRFMARTLTEAGGAGLRRRRGQRGVAGELRLEADAPGRPLLPGERRAELAGAGGHREPVRGDRPAPALGHDRPRPAAALRGGDRGGAADLAVQPERVRSAPVAARPERERDVLGRETAHL